MVLSTKYHPFKLQNRLNTKTPQQDYKRTFHSANMNLWENKGNYNKYLTSQKRQNSTALLHQNMKMNTFGFATKHSCNSCQALLTWFLKLQNAHKVCNNQKLYFQILTKGRNSDSCPPKSMHGMQGQDEKMYGIN